MPNSTTNMDSYNDELLTIKAAIGLMRLKNSMSVRKRLSKALLKEKRTEFLMKAREVRMKNLSKTKNRSNAMKAMWAKRKAAEGV